jgi:hypothetical protein
MAAPARSTVELLMGSGMPGGQARVIAAALDLPSVPLVGASPEATIAMNCGRDAEGGWRYLADGQAAIICLPRDDPMFIANAVTGLAGEPVLEWVTVWEAPAIAPPGVVEVPYVFQDGDVLNCTMGAWTGAPSQYAYQWLSDGTTAIGTDDPSYTPSAADSGHSIACVVSATNALGTTEAPPSNAVVVEEPPAEPGAARGAPGRDPVTGQFIREGGAEAAGEDEAEGTGGPQ